MAWSSGDSRGGPAQSAAAPALPRICVGYLLGIATLVAEMLAISLRPELAKEPPLIPPLYLFLANFISLGYWLVCVYEFHVVLMHASSGTYPIKPLRAAWFHLIPSAQLPGFCGVSFARPRTWHDFAILGWFTSFAILALCLVVASRSTARPAAFLLISRSKENKCREQFVGRCCFVG